MTFNSGGNVLHVLIIIVNYRTAALVVECLRSLRAEVAAAPGTRVVIVDCHSNDGSVARLDATLDAEGWRRWVTLLPLTGNGGFAFGNNTAIRADRAGSDPGRYIWLLNPDTLVRPGALRELVGFMERNPRVGIAGSRLEDPAGRVQRSAHRAPSLLSELNSGVRLGILSRLLNGRPGPAGGAAACEWVSGASMLIRGSLFESIGLFDEGYFLYYEEVDFCRRARHAGWEIWYVPAAQVVHREGESTGIRAHRRPTYWFDSRRRYFARNHGEFYASLADLARLVGLIAGGARRLAEGVPDGDPPNFLADFVRHSVRATLHRQRRASSDQVSTWPARLERVHE